ncbi:hypothetical protein [Algicola sagamiensis]|uniref:hypothetical protein n=1 Tax=Algicola sagamiensis TaxID=163869 RepID=UPI00037E4BCD|nr:hypothetical protein [Algicola sagamiensis]
MEKKKVESTRQIQELKEDDLLLTQGGNSHFDFKVNVASQALHQKSDIAGGANGNIP